MAVPPGWILRLVAALAFAAVVRVDGWHVVASGWLGSVHTVGSSQGFSTALGSGPGKDRQHVVTMSRRSAQKRIRAKRGSFTKIGENFRGKVPEGQSGTVEPETCPVCKGARSVACSICDGSGDIPKTGFGPRNMVNLSKVVGTKWTSIADRCGHRHFMAWSRRGGTVRDAEIEMVNTCGPDEERVRLWTAVSELKNKGEWRMGWVTLEEIQDGMSDTRPCNCCKGSAQQVCQGCNGVGKVPRGEEGSKGPPDGCEDYGQRRRAVPGSSHHRSQGKGNDGFGGDQDGESPWGAESPWGGALVSGSGRGGESESERGGGRQRKQRKPRAGAEAEAGAGAGAVVSDSEKLWKELFEGPDAPLIFEGEASKRVRRL